MLKNEIYYVPRQVQLVDDNGNQTYILGSLSDDYLHETAHRIDCEKLILNNDDEEISNFFGTNNNWLGAYSFKSKEIKYDKIYSKSQGKYIYDHRVFTDYNCIVDSNYEVTDASGNKIDGNTEPLTYLINNANKNGSPFENNIYYKLLSYRIAIAKERNNLYKTTAFPENYGYQIINKNKTISGSDDINISSALIDRQVKEIKKIEITIEDTENNTLGVYTDKIYLELNGDSNFSYDAQIISTTSRSRRTLEFSKDFDHNSDNFEASLQSIKIYFENSNTKATLKSIRVYYK